MMRRDRSPMALVLLCVTELPSAPHFYESSEEELGMDMEMDSLWFHWVCIMYVKHVQQYVRAEKKHMCVLIGSIVSSSFKHPLHVNDMEMVCTLDSRPVDY